MPTAVRRRRRLITAAVLCLFGTVPVLAAEVSSEASIEESIEGSIDSGRQAELQYLLAQDCGSCHGMTRKGGLGPALLPNNLEGKPDELLVATILDGRTGTAMPPWRGQLTEAEAEWLVQQLRRGME